jgi:hypothetical protein
MSAAQTAQEFIGKAESIGQQPMDPSDVAAQTHDPQKIAELAYTFWEARGRRDGSAEEDWARAEQALYGDASAGEKRSI